MILDVSCGIHVDAIMKIPEFQQKCTRMKSLKTVKNDRTEKSIISNKNVDQRKKYNRVLKPTTASALSASMYKCLSKNICTLIKLLL